MTIQEIFKKLRCGHKEFDVSLKKFTTYKLNTIASLIVTPRNIDDLKLILKTVKDNNLKYKILGNGSNLVFASDRYDGVLIKLDKLDNLEIKRNVIVVGAGYNLVKYLVDDLIYEKDLEYHFIDDLVCLSFVPISVIKKYVDDKKMIETIIKLKKDKKMVNPLSYKRDNSLKRRAWLLLRNYNYIKNCFNFQL